MKNKLFFRVQITMDGARRGPISSGYRPTFRFDGRGVEHRSGTVLLREGGKLSSGASTTGLLQPLNQDTWKDVSEGCILLVCEGFTQVGVVEILEVFK